MTRSAPVDAPRGMVDRRSFLSSGIAELDQWRRRASAPGDVRGTRSTIRPAQRDRRVMGKGKRLFVEGYRVLKLARRLIRGCWQLSGGHIA
jgi:hypothetical protein